jgi:protein-S-isoprenylcysteine O-methyltransferase Ste14
MNPWIGKAVVLAASTVMVIIRAPHGHRSRGMKTVKSCSGTRETVLLTVAWIGFFVPLIWIVSPVLTFADYRLRPVPLVAGIGCFIGGLWLFYRSHADLGKYWSITLEVREHHRLITEGTYRRVRHPMYAALFLYSVGQVLVLPNYIAGPSYLLAFGILFALRVGAEERMMLEAFGDEYKAYSARTWRLVPGVW